MTSFTFNDVRISPNQPSTQAGQPIIVNAECPGPGRWRAGPGSLEEEEVHPPGGSFVHTLAREVKDSSFVGHRGSRPGPKIHKLLDLMISLANRLKILSRGQTNNDHSPG